MFCFFFTFTLVNIVFYMEVNSENPQLHAWHLTTDSVVCIHLENE